MSFLLLTSIENTLQANNSEITMQIKAATIIIDGDIELAANASSGNGIQGDPYFIENYVIDGASVNCIDIRNTDAHFIIRNCTVFNGLNGIYLENVSNAEVRNNTIHDNVRVSGNNEGNGIFLNASDSNTLIENNIYNNTGGAGLYSGNGVRLKESDNNTIINNVIYNNTGGSGWMSGNGIMFEFNNQDNTAISNTIYGNTGGSGDYSGNGISFVGISDAMVIDNFIHNNTGTADQSGNGILIRNGADRNEFIQNIIVNNTQYGVNVSASTCDDNYFYQNIIWENNNQIPTFTDQVFDIGTNTTWASNIHNPDTDDDGDGLSNENETTLGTSPFQDDTDGDGLNDGDELNTHSTNPLISDSDGDGYSDGVEIALGTNPLNPSDYPGKSTPDYSIVIIIILIIVVSALGVVSAFLFLKMRHLKTENEELMKKSSKLKEKTKKISKPSKGK